MKREFQVDTLEQMCDLMCGGSIIDSHNKSKLDFYSFIWEYFGVSPTEYKTSKDKFKRTMMTEYENYLEEENY